MIADGATPDRYRRLALLGSGATGQVWLVEDALRPGSRLALKELTEERPGAETALRREFVWLSRLRHPGLVEAYDLDRSPVSGQLRLALEYVEGSSIAEVTGEGPAAFLELIADALGALNFLHDFGLVHRDLKPAHVLVRRWPRLGSRVVFLDLGLAVDCPTDPSAEPDAPAPAGTLPYLAPEMLAGLPAGRRSDLFALGAVLAESLDRSLRPADVGRDQRRSDESRPRPKLPDGWPAGLAGWLADLMHADPRQRPAGAREALALLNVACGTALTLDTARTRAARLASDPPPGRESELRQLWSLLDAPAGPRIVWLTGPPGSGKSRILRWLRAEAIGHSFRVVGPAPTVTEGRAEEDEALERLRSRAYREPTLVLLDEIESGPARTWGVLERIAREGKAAPLRVVVALRPAEVTDATLKRLLENTGAVPTLHRIHLRPLGVAGVRALVERALGSTSVAESRVIRLVEESEGNPMLVEAALVGEGLDSGKRARRASRLARSIVTRVDLLSPAGRAWLVALVVLGNDVGEMLVSRVAGLEPAVAREAADEVRLAGLARLVRGRFAPESRWVVEQVLGRLDSAGRRDRCRRAAGACIEVEGPLGEPARLARLWSSCGENERAIEAAERAARLSELDGDSAAEAAHWSFVLKLLRLGDSRARRIRARKAHALAAAGRHAAAARSWAGALGRRTDSDQRADWLGLQALELVQAGRFGRARIVAEAALRLADRNADPAAEARASRALGLVFGRLGREAEACPLFERALAIYQSSGDVGGEADTLHALAAAKDRQQRADAGDDFRRAVELYRRLGRPRNELKSIVGLAIIHMRAGQLDPAESLLEDVRRRALDHGDLELLETSLSRLASLAIARGRLDKALDLGQEALDQAVHLGDRNRALLDRCRLAEALVACGRPAQAADLLRAGLESPLEQVEPDAVDYARLMLAHALLEAPGADERDVGQLLDLARHGFQERGRQRPLASALVLELERRSRPGEQEPFDPIWSAWEALERDGVVGVADELAVRSRLARSALEFMRGNDAIARDLAVEAARLGRLADLPALEARAAALEAQVAERQMDQTVWADAIRRGARLRDAAAARIDDPSVRASFLDRPAMRELVRGGTATRSGADRRLIALYEMIRTVNSETDPEALLEAILDMALSAVEAERGMILLASSEGGIAVRLARNLERETEREAEDFSRTIVAEAGAGRSIVALDAAGDPRFRELKSVALHGVRSLMCVPLRSRGRIIGTVYLDSRRRGGLFDGDDLRFVEAFADHAALALENARERDALARENRRLSSAVEERVRFGELVGRSESMRAVFHLLERVAESDLPVLIQGESGTGKELVARAIHLHGSRRRKIFLSENCAAIPEALLESELFGHVRGSFTSADRDRRGLFELADGGTLFLDEVGDMSPPMQARLLRELQEGEIRRVGGERPQRVDVRILAATHRDLPQEVAAGRFREDLFYRMHVLSIRIPPLRERPDDVDLLIDHQLERIGRERGRTPIQLTPGAREALLRHDWPGNVRQLENCLQRLTLLAGDRPIDVEALSRDESLRSLVPAPCRAFAISDGVRDQVRRALSAAGGNREKAAKLLGVSRATIYRKIRELGLN